MKAELSCFIIDKVIFMATKTNAVRLVLQSQIPCREHFYEFDENDLNGNHAAAAIGMPPEQVFKTLVARGAKTGIHVFCIPVSRGLCRYRSDRQDQRGHQGLPG